jgi:putative NADH-flavin reductase
MIIWILGWAGRIWQVLIQEALWRKHQVITLVRNKDKLQQYKDRISIIQWDATHTKDMTNFLSQVDVVIHAVSVPFFHKKPTKLYSQTTQTIISARWNSKCKKVIVMSNTWTQHGRKLPWPANLAYELLLGDVADDKETEELLLQKSWLPWTIIKSPVLTNGQKKSYTLQNFDTYTPTIFSFISRKTIASVIIDIAENNTYNQQKVVPNSKFLF